MHQQLRLASLSTNYAFTRMRFDVNNVLDYSFGVAGKVITRDDATNVKLRLGL